LTFDARFDILKSSFFKMGGRHMNSLTRFLIAAKKNTYAVLPDGKHQFQYESAAFKYMDGYKGLNPFMGEEMVWQNGALVWGMNYYGGLYAEDKDLVKPQEVYNFLSSALRQVPEDAPFRRPRMFKEGNFSYYNGFRGSVVGFRGEEQIKWMGARTGNLIPGRPLYFLLYHGGSLAQDEGGLTFRPFPLQ
jgi:hypothetical protein